MYRKFGALFATLLFGVNAAFSQTVAEAVCSDDGKAHLAYGNASTKIISAEAKQVGCADISIAEDKRTVGWSVLVENCCTSYPIPIAVVVLRDGKKTVIPSTQMVWRWRFVDHGKRVAMLSGPVHGWAREAVLYDAHSGKIVESWRGTKTAPEWAKDWQQEFAPHAE